MKTVSRMFAEESVLKVSSRPIPTEYVYKNGKNINKKVSGHTRIPSHLPQKQVLTQSLHFENVQLSRHDDGGRVLGVF